MPSWYYTSLPQDHLPQSASTSQRRVAHQGSRDVVNYRDDAPAGVPRRPAPGSPADMVAKRAAGQDTSTRRSDTSTQRSSQVRATDGQAANAAAVSRPATSRAAAGKSAAGKSTAGRSAQKQTLVSSSNNAHTLATFSNSNPGVNLGYVKENGGYHRWTDTSYTQPKDFNRSRMRFIKTATVAALLLLVVIVIIAIVLH